MDFKINKCIIREVGDQLTVSLDVERDDVDIMISKTLDKNNSMDKELLQVINNYAFKHLSK